MTAILLAERPPVPVIPDATAGVRSLPPAVVDLPADYDLARQYVTPPAEWVEEPYTFPPGPPTPNPNRCTLAMAVQEIAG